MSVRLIIILLVGNLIPTNASHSLRITTKIKKKKNILIDRIAFSSKIRYKTDMGYILFPCLWVFGMKANPLWIEAVVSVLLWKQ